MKRFCTKYKKVAGIIHISLFLNNTLVLSESSGCSSLEDAFDWSLGFAESNGGLVDWFIKDNC